MVEQSWEELLKQFELKVEEERKLWSERLKEKIDELKTFKYEMIKLQQQPIELLKTRESRLKELELKCEEERQYVLKEEDARRKAEDALRLAQNKFISIEKENEYFRTQLTAKSKELNELRLNNMPLTHHRSTAPQERISDLEKEIEETENFYRRISERIDNLLKY